MFSDVSTIIFTVDTTAYPKLLFEAESVNRMQERLTLLNQTANDSRFLHTPLILLMTHIDLLDETLELRPVDKCLYGFCFDSYKGHCSFEAGVPNLFGASIHVPHWRRWEPQKLWGVRWSMQTWFISTHTQSSRGHIQRYHIDSGSFRIIWSWQTPGYRQVSFGHRGWEFEDLQWRTGMS